MLLAQEAAGPVIELIKLLPDGASVIAVIVVVLIFLKNQREFNEHLRTIAADFAKQLINSKKESEEQVKNLTQSYLANEKYYQQQIQKLFDDFIKVSTETIKAVQQLESAVRELRDQVKRNKEP